MTLYKNKKHFYTCKSMLLLHDTDTNVYIYIENYIDLTCHGMCHSYLVKIQSYSHENKK